MMFFVAGYALAVFGQEGAQTPAPSATPAVTKSTRPAPPPELRDPFVPMGTPDPTLVVIVQPTAPTATASTAPVSVQVPTMDGWPKLVVKAKMKGKGGKNVAIIEGYVGVVEAGEVITLEFGGVLYRWRID